MVYQKQRQGPSVSDCTQQRTELHDNGLACCGCTQPGSQRLQAELLLCSATTSLKLELRSPKLTSIKEMPRPSGSMAPSQKAYLQSSMHQRHGRLLTWHRTDGNNPVA